MPPPGISAMSFDFRFLRRWRAAVWLAAGLTGAAWSQTPVAPIQVQPLQAPVTPTPVSAVPSSPTGSGTGQATPGAAPPNPLATINADYKLAPNDLLEFDIFGIPDIKRDVRINASGLVSLPLVGPVMIAGMTAQEAEIFIAAKYAEKYLQDPQVSLFIKEFTTQRITVEGAVLRPGIYPVVGQLTLLRALALAGGYAQYADLKEIMVYRILPGGKRESYKYDLDQVRSGQTMDPDVLSDDVIVVKRDSSRTALRDSLFRDIVDTINPFSGR